VPERAIGTHQGQKFALVVNDKNAVEERPVTLGQREDGSVVVKDGLNATDRVIVSEVGKLRAGMTVKPREEPAGSRPD
jgi:multidrug efflux pump subunit AcrA (membrane-fusion protein)